ncbi:hypothetical protein [Niallia hominis]|uniref:Uncharacterized protein n=1 Tax=Niallia hominis TaxID=3133173 RepID=A0ABV1EWI9_9BACI
MREFTILKFFDRFKGLFLKIGIDYSVLRTILQVKLTMDQRKLPTIFSQSNQRKERRQICLYKIVMAVCFYGVDSYSIDGLR